MLAPVVVVGSAHPSSRILSPGSSCTLWYISPSILLMQATNKDGRSVSPPKPQEAKRLLPPGKTSGDALWTTLYGSYQELPPHPVDPFQGWGSAVEQGQGGPQGKSKRMNAHSLPTMIADPFMARRLADSIAHWR